jgi:hypothetical protein
MQPYDASKSLSNSPSAEKSKIALLETSVEELKSSLSNIEKLLLLPIFAPPNDRNNMIAPKTKFDFQINPVGSQFDTSTFDFAPGTWFQDDNGSFGVDTLSASTNLDTYFQSSSSPSSEITITNSGILMLPQTNVTNDYSANYHRPDYATITDIISSAMPQFSIVIAPFLENHFQATKARITGFRARAVAYFPGQVKPWPVVEWREDQDTDVSVIFDIENLGSPCSYLMHTGVELGWHGECRRWRKSSLMWLVAEIHQLKELFVAAQQILGILQWSEADGPNVCHDRPSNCSQNA